MEHKVSQGHSPAGENAGSPAPFEMTSLRTVLFTLHILALETETIQP
jgi:hypothetical protein